MLKPAAFIFGIFFLVAGIGGFFPALAPGGMLFGMFMVGPIHNCIHLASGAVALLCGFAGAGAARKYFQIFGVVYLLVALLGFYYGNNPLVGMVEHNQADIWLHIGIAAVALFLGFTGKSEGSAATG